MTKAAPRSSGSAGPDGAPYRHLAVRVIDQALKDLTGPAGARADRESARAFLAGSSMLLHWCEVADLDPTWMVARARALNGSGTPHRRRRCGPTG
jgi:hypothetical protein